LLALGATDVTLVPGSRGAFEITVDGRLAWSKQASGRFPADAEIDTLLED
jgi:selT/selW/selH-like putative selenoprotein